MHLSRNVNVADAKAVYENTGLVYSCPGEAKKIQNQRRDLYVVVARIESQDIVCNTKQRRTSAHFVEIL